MGLLAMNYMFDLMGGMQMRHWVVQPKFTKKQTIDNAARSAGYQFIRDKGPKSNNKNQFMELTDEQIHTAGSPLKIGMKEKSLQPGRTFLEPQGLRRIGLKSVQDKCSNLAKGISFTPLWNTSFALCLPYALHLALSPRTLTEKYNQIVLTWRYSVCNWALAVSA